MRRIHASGNCSTIADPNEELIAASMRLNVTGIRFLLENCNGIDINIQDSAYGYTPLIWASENGHLEMVQVLLGGEGIDIDKTTASGWTALMRASKNGHQEVVELLLEAEGIDINKVDNERHTALYWAFYDGHSDIALLILEEEGIDINYVDYNSGKTALAWASEIGSSEIVQLILKREEVDVNSTDIDGKTPLYWASYKGYSEEAGDDHPQRFHVGSSDLGGQINRAGGTKIFN